MNKLFNIPFIIIFSLLCNKSYFRENFENFKFYLVPDELEEKNLTMAANPWNLHKYCGKRINNVIYYLNNFQQESVNSHIRRQIFLEADLQALSKKYQFTPRNFMSLCRITLAGQQIGIHFIVHMFTLDGEVQCDKQ